MRRSLIFFFAIALVAAFAQSALAKTETLTVSNTKPKAVRSTTVLKPDHIYSITASGRISDWDDDYVAAVGGPKAASWDGFGVDAIWCYAEWRCGEGALWRQLRVKRASGKSWSRGSGVGLGLDEFAGLEEPPAPSKDHRYTVQVTGVRGKLDFATWDAFVLGSHGGNKGFFRVTIKDLGTRCGANWKNPPPECEYVTFDFGGVVPGHLLGGPRYRYTLNGRGQLAGPQDANRLVPRSGRPVLDYTVGRTFNLKPYRYSLAVVYGYDFIDIEKYKRTGAPFRALKLAVRVIRSNDRRCRRGRAGRVVIKENFARNQKGRLVDSVQSVICGKGAFYTRTIGPVRITPAWGAPLGPPRG